MADRCEPPEELRGQDGWHWIETPDGDATLGLWGRGLKCWTVVGATEFWFSKPLEIGNWRYLAPATPPGEVAALRATVARLEADLARLVEAGEGTLDALWSGGWDDKVLRAALAAIKGSAPAQHRTRMSDAGSYDEVCIDCGATDARGDDRLTKPCPGKKERAP